MPRWTLPNSSLSTKNGTPRFAACTSFTAHEFSTNVSSLLVVHNSRKHPVFTRLRIYVEKVFFSDFTLMVFAFLLGMPAETLQIVFSTQRPVWSRDLACWNKKRTTQLCCRWLSISRSHSPCTEKNLLDGNQLLFPVTKLILLSSSTIAQVIASERFLEIKFEGTPGFEPGTSRTAAECSTTELSPWIS